MDKAYEVLYITAAVVLGLALLCCLVRAVRGPRTTDRVIAVNMMGTTTVVIICVLAFLLGEGYLVDVAMIYTMLSFLAVVLLSKIVIGLYHERRAKAREAAEQAAQQREKAKGVEQA